MIVTAEEKVIQQAVNWTGYLEKSSDKDLDDFTANAGDKNYTCFAADYKLYTGYQLQAQPWCAIFVSIMYVSAFGLETAKKLLCGNLFHYCPTGVNQFKAKGRFFKKPVPGDVIFFTNGIRASHTGIVTGVTKEAVQTVEGNTSSAKGVIVNGGGVWQKKYSLTNSRILGYGRPDYTIVEQIEEGWRREADGIRWRYQYADGTGAMGWKLIHNRWYYFDQQGYMVTGHVMIDSEEFYLCEHAGSDNGACMVTDERGALKIWEINNENL